MPTGHGRCLNYESAAPPPKNAAAPPRAGRAGRTSNESTNFARVVFGILRSAAVALAAKEPLAAKLAVGSGWNHVSEVATPVRPRPKGAFGSK